MVRIAEVSGGNPFYALELARAVPTGAGRLRHRATRHAGRPRASQNAPIQRGHSGVLLAAACVANPTVELTGAATGLPPARVVELLEQPERDGLVSIDGNRVRFAHPLLARGVYTHAGAAQRRRMHRALAEVEPQPELKARHWLSGSTSADDARAAVARFGGRGGTRPRRARGGGRTDRPREAAGRRHSDAAATGRGRPLPGGRHSARHSTYSTSTLDDLRPGPLRAIALLLLAGIRVYDNGFADALKYLQRGARERRRQRLFFRFRR